MKRRITLSPRIEGNGQRAVCFDWPFCHGHHENTHGGFLRAFPPTREHHTTASRFSSGLISQGLLALGLMLWSLPAFGANQFGTILEHNIGVLGTHYYRLEYKDACGNWSPAGESSAGAIAVGATHTDPVQWDAFPSCWPFNPWRYWWSTNANGPNLNLDPELKSFHFDGETIHFYIEPGVMPPDDNGDGPCPRGPSG